MLSVFMGAWESVCLLVFNSLFSVGFSSCCACAPSALGGFERHSFDEIDAKKQIPDGFRQAGCWRAMVLISFMIRRVGCRSCLTGYPDSSCNGSKQPFTL